MPLAQLINPQVLLSRLHHPNLRILDCRFSLDDPDYGNRSYAQGHIPGAYHADLERDLSGEVILGVTGRHPLPQAQDLLTRLRGWGLNNTDEVVLYDDGPGAFAARAWWLLAWLGKRDGVYLLDGGLTAWIEAGLPLEEALPDCVPGTFAGKPDDALTIQAPQLMKRLGDQQLTLLDARSLPRFLGEVEPIDPVAGHIPGARCAPFNENLAPSGRFLEPEQLRARFSKLLDGRPSETLAAYCGSGVTACHNLFALCLAGFPLAPLYPGSWSEWIVDPAHPVARQEHS